MARRSFKDIFDLSKNTDVDRTVLSISNGVTLRGYNIWILICSVFLASIGLDTNSAAVIIGAMLISPLMSPILGIGLSLGMHDKELFVRSLRNLAIATILALVTSTFYFFVTPFGDITSELLARTHPTLLDVMVAFFGGIAGIVSMSRHESTNAIPGVAIATALMPPLCTAGYGIASGNMQFFLGAFYLFFINAMFISLSTYLIVRYLHFPIKSYIDKNLQRTYTRLTWILLMLALAPSIYFLYTVYNDSRTKKTIETLVIDNLQRDHNEILKWNVNLTDSAKVIEIYYSGEKISAEHLQEIETLCSRNGIRNCHIKALRVNLTREEITGLSTDVARQMLNEWEIQMLAKSKEDSIAINSWKTDAWQLSREVGAAFSFIDSAYVGRMINVKGEHEADTLTGVWYTAPPKAEAGAGKTNNQFFENKVTY